jgi:outer membrane protein OmpA-like peptidoglycan-associated protein
VSDPDAPPSRTQQLIALADQVATAPEPRDEESKWPIIALIGGAIVGVLAIAGLALALLRDTSGDELRAAENEAASEAEANASTSATPDSTVDAGAAPATSTDSTPDTSPDDSVVEPPTETVTATTQAPAPTTTVETEPAPATTVASTSVPDAAPATTVASDQVAAVGEQPVRWAEFSGGKVYLEGTVPDQATADEVRDKAAAVVGADNVIVDYAIVAGAPRPPSAPLYVRDSVLFAKNSVDINAAARGVLDLGVALMQQNPQVTIDVQGHTDSDGSDEMNQLLSQRRVDVIFDYLVSQGVDPARLTKAAYGESRPIADNATAAGRAMNRRVEFTINNLLG